MKKNLIGALVLLSILFFAVSCEKEETHKKYLNGIWKADDTWCVEIKKDKGYFVLLRAEEQFPGLSRFLKIGDVAIKDLKKTGNNTWSGKEIAWRYWVSTGEVYELDWSNATFVLSEDKQSFVRISEFGNLTYYKVNNILDEVPYSNYYFSPNQVQRNIVDDNMPDGMAKTGKTGYFLDE